MVRSLAARAQRCEAPAFVATACLASARAHCPRLESLDWTLEWRVFRDRCASRNEESPGKSPARASAPRAAPASRPRHLPPLIASAEGCNLQASTAWSAPEEISAFYSSYTGHEPSTERKQSFERPADDDFGPIDHPGLRVANVARAGPASIPIRRRRRLRGLRKRCGGLRRSRDPLGSDRAVPVARSPAQTLRLR